MFGYFPCDQLSMLEIRLLRVVASQNSQLFEISQKSDKSLWPSSGPKYGTYK